MSNLKTHTNEDKQFYPTPKSFLGKIYQDFYEQFGVFYREKKYNIKVLEPSAGKGNIALFLRDTGQESWRKFPKCDIECIELDKTLQATLRGLNFPVVYDDFLSFDTYTKYDLIFMNPPFGDADKHLLKAIALQTRYGGRILCMLNAETLSNPYSQSRKDILSYLKKYKAEVKYYQSPFCAYDSERLTSVDIAVIWIDIPTPDSLLNSRFFDEMDAAQDVKLNIPNSEARNDLIKLGLDWIATYAEQYKEHVEVSLAFIKEYEAFRNIYKLRFANVLADATTYQEPFSLKLYGKDFTDINDFLKKLRRHYWEAIFSNPNFSKRLTNNLKDELRARLDTFELFDFTEHNILVLLEENMRATIKGIEETIMELFDKLTSYAQYDGCDNVHYYNGWKTNAAHKLNKKIIIPFSRAWSAWPRYKYHHSYCTRNGTEYHLDVHEAYATLSDMSKTLNYLAKGVSELQDTDKLYATITENFERGNAKNIQTQFFTVTFYKKGTCHITFLNDDLLAKFNIFASRHRNWLPPSYGVKHYEQMDKEEQAVIDAFQGKSAYENIMQHKDKYLTTVSVGSRLLLE